MTPSRLPSIHVEKFLAKERHDDGPVCKDASSQRLERLLRRRVVLILDEDLADARVIPGACRARNLDLQDLAVLGAFFLDVFLDLCSKVELA